LALGLDAHRSGAKARGWGEKGSRDEKREFVQGHLTAIIRAQGDNGGACGCSGCIRKRRPRMTRG
jgi:hypothetical protein